METMTLELPQTNTETPPVQTSESRDSKNTKSNPPKSSESNITESKSPQKQTPPPKPPIAQKITITIEGREFEAFDGETILDVARRNGVQIPTICYLSGCSPTLACKMCMVEVNGKRAYSCNAKIKDKMNVVVHNEALDSDRNDIMTTYCVNHPLECGVCDKSGECELQDFTLYTQVDVQKFGLKEADKKSYSFAQSFYDPALCIMCERCATTCKDNIGENNLKAGKATLFSPDSYKDTMSKDPFSVWQKRQKGLIEFIGKYECKDCGECISVCPVGAMTYKDFTYRSNAWELEKIHSTCTHCAGGCELIYNVKHLDVKGDLKKVYRVQNDYLYNPICGTGRFAFDMVSVGSRNLASVSVAFNTAEAIFLGGGVSNEEALLTQLISSKLNIPIYNREARFYQVFQREFLLGCVLDSMSLDSEVSSSLESDSLNSSDLKSKIETEKIESSIESPFATFEDVKTLPNIISLNAYFKYDAPSLRYKINNNLKMQKGSTLITFGVFKDSLLQELGKNVTQIIGNPESVSMMGILGLVFANDLALAFESEFGKTSLCAVNLILKSLNIENLDSIKLSKKQGVLLTSLDTIEEFVHSDLINISSDDYVSRIRFLAKLLAFICKNLGLKLLYIPKEANIIGISNICTLGNPYDLCNFVGFNDSLSNFKSAKNIIGIRTSGVFVERDSIDASSASFTEQDSITNTHKNSKNHNFISADFVLDSNISTIRPHFALPTLAQCEGSITSMEYRVLPLKPSVPFVDSRLESAYDLSDVARGIGILDSDLLENIDYLGDFSAVICEFARRDFLFKDINFLDLKAYFERDGSDNRGYKMSINSEIFKDFDNSKKLKMDFYFKDSIKNDTKDFCVSKNSQDSESLSEGLQDSIFLQDSDVLESSSLESSPRDSKILALRLESQNQFSLTTQASKNLQTKVGIYTSKNMLEKYALKEGESITLQSENGNVSGEVYCDFDLDSDVFLVSPLIVLNHKTDIFSHRFYTFIKINQGTPK